MKAKNVLLMAITVVTILMMSICASATVSATEAKNEGQWVYSDYTYDGTEGVEVIGYTGTKTDIYIPALIAGKPVLRVGDSAFKDMTGLKSVTFSANIKEVGNSAFSGATSLVCVLFNESLVSIGDDVFDGCTLFNSVILYESISNIGDTIFTDCKNAVVYYIGGTFGESYALADESIKEAVLISEEATPTEIVQNGIKFYVGNGEAVAVVNENPDRTGIVVPAVVGGCPVTRIMENCFAFEKERSIDTFIIPNTIRKIGQYAFKYCNFVTYSAIELPEGIRIIEPYAFSYTKGIAFIFPDSVTEIQDYAFYYANYESLKFSENSQLRKIGNCAFYGSGTSFHSSEGIYLPITLESIGDYAFGNTWVKSLTITNRNTVLGKSLFYENDYFSKLYIPNGLTTSTEEVWKGAYHSGPEAVYITDVADWVENNFYPKYDPSGSYSGINLYCLDENGKYTLDFDIPEGITDINGAFNYCKNINTIKIPSTVETLGTGDLTSYYITSMEFSTKTLKTIEDGAFSPSISTIYMDSLEDYLEIQSNYVQKPLRYASAVYVKNSEGEYEQTRTLVIPDTYTTITTNTFRGVYVNSSITYYASWFDTLVISKNVSSVEANAFQYCPSLKNVHIYVNENTLSFSTDAFSGCDNIENAYVDSFEKWCKNVTVASTTANPLFLAENLYVNDTLYTIAEIPADYTLIPKYLLAGNWIHEVKFLGNQVTGISAYAFQGSVNLKSIQIPDTVTYISNYAFADCTALSGVVLPEGLTYISTGVFRNCSSLNSITIPSKVRYVGDYAFSNSGLETVENKAYLEYVSAYSFSNTNISEINIYSVTTVGDYAFSSCDNLKQVTLGNNLKTIGKYAFSSCTSLEQIIIPANVTKIQNGAFNKCSSLSKVTIASTKLTYIADWAFSNCTMLGNVSIPNTVTEIGQAAFMNCLGITSFVVPDSVTRLENSVFEGCENLAEITLSNRIGRLDTYVLESTAIKKLKIPESVTQIDTMAFGNCSELEEVYFPKSLDVSKYNSKAFEYTPDFTAYLYKNSGAHSYITKYKPNCKIVFLADFADDVITYTIDDQTKTATALSCLKSAVGEVTVKDRIEVTSDDGTVEYYPVVKIGDDIFRDCKTITKINLPDTLMEIGKYAFANCLEITELQIPESVTIIGDYAFSGNLPVESITISGNVKEPGNYLFADNTTIDNVIFANGVEKIGDYTFKNCYSLSNVTMSDSVHTIGKYAFWNLPNLKINLSEKLTDIGEGAFKDCTNIVLSLNLTGNMKNIGAYAFNNCKKITSVSIAAGDTVIADSAFEGCVSLTDVTLSADTLSIGANAFKSSGIEEITIPSKVKLIADSAFENCTSLSAVTLNAEELSLGEKVFMNSGIEAIVIPSGVKVIPNSAFMNCAELKTVELSNGIESIGANAFKNTKITDFTIPGTVTEIGEAAFDNCMSLVNVSLSNGLKSISSSLFNNCSSLSAIIIPDSVQSIGASAFKNCTSLKSVTLPDSATALPADTFSGCHNLSKIINIEGYTEYGNKCFADCYNIQPAEVLHENLEVIGDSTFRYAFTESAIGLALPESIKSVGSQAFSYCTSIVKVRIPESLSADTTTIALDAFLYSPEAILWVYKDSFGHNYALESDRLYFIIKNTANPEIDYGTAISGYVKYTNGTPAANVTVKLLYDDGTEVNSVTTDANGQYTFKFAEVGAYTLRAYDNEDSGNIDTETVSVERKNVFSVILKGNTNLTLRRGWTVSGVATATGGVSEDNPISVTMTDLAGNRIASQTITSPYTSFSFENINNDEYIVLAENNNGSAYTTITVYNKNYSGLNLVIDDFIPDDPDPDVQTGFASIVGRVFVEERINEDDPSATPERNRRDWIKLTIYDENGNIIKHTKSAVNSVENNYDYIFKGLPIGEYSIVAEVTVIRPHYHELHKDDPKFKNKNCEYEQPFVLKGYAYVEITESRQYVADDIILAEENDNVTSIKGKITAKGSSQSSNVILRDIFHHEIATVSTPKNGKFEFKNIRDGIYFLTAITEYDGVGFAVVYLRNGVIKTKFFDEESKLNGGNEIHIKVGKHDRIPEYEAWFESGGRLSECTKKNVSDFIVDLEELKQFYDSLSNRDKQGFAPAYLEKFWQMLEWLSNTEKIIDTENSGYTDEEKNKISVDNVGSIIPSEDIDGQVKYSVTLTIDRLSEEEFASYDISATSGNSDDIEITTDEQYYQSNLEETSKNNGKTLGQKKKNKDGEETEDIEYFYYNIEFTFSKGNSGEIKVSDIAKETDTNGKLRITLPIPKDFIDDECTSYSLLHIHNGEIIMLTDLDDNPDTITVEVDKFSVFAFAKSYEEQVGYYTVTWKDEDGTVLEMDENVRYGDTPEYNGNTPVKKADAEFNYVFSGWSPEISEVEEDIIYTATYGKNENTYTVTWKNYDGTVLETDVNVPYGTTPEYNGATPVKTADAQYSYTFKGWEPDASTVVGNVTYTATFTENIITGDIYTVSFKCGEIVFTEHVVAGNSITLPEATSAMIDAFVPEREGEPVSAYTLFWKLNMSDVSLLSEIYTETDGYYLPGAHFALTDSTTFEAVWVYTDAELVLVSNADKADKSKFEHAFDIYLSSIDASSVTKIESGEFSVNIISGTQDKFGYELIPNSGITFDIDDTNKVLFKRANGDTEHLVPEAFGEEYRILLGTLKITGSGEGSASLTNASAHRHISDNRSLDVFVRDVSIDYMADISTAKLEVVIDFKNTVKHNPYKYQNMTLTISGSDLSAPITVQLGSDSPQVTVDEKYKSNETVTVDSSVENKYTVTLEGILTVNRAYTVTIEGAGYRTTRYTVAMNNDKELYFWNNVMDNGTLIEKSESSSKRVTTFLAGDIVKDNDINIYDLSAVVSYFGAMGISLDKNPGYIKYDLNRDGKIDSIDVAYVLVSWNR